MTKADKLRKVCNEINSDLPVMLDLDNHHMLIYADSFTKFSIIVAKYNLIFVRSQSEGGFVIFTVTV
jgi:hypothetical protein